MNNKMQLNDFDLAPATPSICGYLGTYGMTHASGDAEKKYVELEGKSISIVGKNGTGKSTTVAAIYFPNPVTMRINPTSIEYSGMGVEDGTNSYASGTWAINQARTYGVLLNYTHGSASLTQYRPYLMNNADLNSYIGWTAEL